MSLPIALGCIIAALVVGCILGGLYRKKVSEREIGSAEEKAKQIINDAYKSAESKRRETLLEAKEEIHKSRTEYELSLIHISAPPAAWAPALAAGDVPGVTADAAPEPMPPAALAAAFASPEPLDALSLIHI